MSTDLLGHGNLNLSTDSWCSCYELAKSFGWNPTIYADDREVSDTDARSFGLALYQAIRAIETAQELTEQQANTIKAIGNVGTIRDLADYADVGSFVIA